MLGALGSLLAPEVSPLQDLQHHWTAFLEYYASKTVRDLKAEPVEKTFLTFHLNKILAILVKEEENSDGKSLLPCLEHVLYQDILNILVTLCQADTPPGIRPYIFKLFIFLLDKVKYALLCETACHLPISRLTLVCSINKASPSESQEIEFLSLLTNTIVEQPHLVQVFIPSKGSNLKSNMSSRKSSKTSSQINLAQIESLALNVKQALDSMESGHYLSTALLNYIDSSDYCVACTALQNIIKLAGVKSDESAECIVYQSSFITVIESRLVYLFQCIPLDIDQNRMEELEVNWVNAHKLYSPEYGQDGFHGRTELICFLSFLDFVDNLVTKAHHVIGSEVSHSIASTLVSLLTSIILSKDSQEKVLRGLSYLGVVWNHIKSTVFRDQFVLSLFDCSSDCNTAVDDSCLANCDSNKPVRSCSAKSFDSKPVTEIGDATNNVTVDYEPNGGDEQSDVKTSTGNNNANITQSNYSKSDSNEKESVTEASHPSCSSQVASKELYSPIYCSSKVSNSDDTISHVATSSEPGITNDDRSSSAASCSCQEENKSSFEKILQLWDNDEEIKLESMRIIDAMLCSPHQLFLEYLVTRYLDDRGYYNQTLTESEANSWSDVEDERSRSRSREPEQNRKTANKAAKEKDELISKTFAPSNIHRVVNQWLYLVDDQLRLDEFRGSGYDVYIKDAGRQVECVLDKCKDFTWDKEVGCARVSSEDNSSCDSRCDSENGQSFFPGPFLNRLFKELEGMLDTNYELNLQLTSLFSTLVQLPHPYIHEFILNPTVSLNPSTLSLYTILRKLVETATVRCASIQHFPKKLQQARRALLHDGVATTNTDCGEAHLLHGIVVLDEFCKELAAISLVKYHIFSGVKG